MNIEKYKQITEQALTSQARLIAVSKTQPNESILELYNAGQRLFGENKVQELSQKHTQLPADIQWHLIGHLQTNKVKYIAPFISLIQSVESLKLLQEINKQAKKTQKWQLNYFLDLSNEKEIDHDRVKILYGFK